MIGDDTAPRQLEGKNEQKNGESSWEDTAVSTNDPLHIVHLRSPIKADKTTTKELRLKRKADKTTNRELRLKRRRGLCIGTISFLLLLNLHSQSFQRFQPSDPAQANIISDGLMLQQLRTAISDEKPQRVPKTAGALIHVGKTGGSTLASVLRNGCHSFVPKPCKPVQNETIVSRVTTYYHTPDWKLLAKRRTYDFYIWTVRDPFSRTVSAFLYGHPDNVLVRKRDYKEKVYNFPIQKLSPIYSRCFPSLDKFAQALKNNHTLTTDVGLEQAATMNCDVLANAMMQHQAKMMSSHLYYDIRLFHRQTNPFKPLFAIRTEFLWDDWININELLGQTPGSVVTKGKRNRDTSKLALPVSSSIGEVEREYLCRAIAPEYKVYFQLLSKTINIQKEDLAAMVEMAQKNCPKLDFKI
jgi:hypothetical protein